jgi:uncharacterized glyoxalase superfamily protein PhnB
MSNFKDEQAACRPFIPTVDLEISKAFYMKLGFTLILDGDVKIFRVGSTSFILAPFEKAENVMLQLMVDNLDAWWDHITKLNLAAEFGVPEPTPPQTQPWGIRITYLVDPSGVLWHIGERRQDKDHDF